MGNSNWGSLQIWGQLSKLEQVLPLQYPIVMSVRDDLCDAEYRVEQHVFRVEMPARYDLATVLALSLRYFLYARAMTHAGAPAFTQEHYERAVSEVSASMRLSDHSRQSLREAFAFYRAENTRHAVSSALH